MQTVTNSLMTIPAPCGLAVTSVTSDNEYLYALQPDRKTVYKLDVCGRIICVFKLQRRYNAIHFCTNGRFYATVEGERYKIYILNGCLREIGAIEPDIPNESTCRDSCGNGTCTNVRNTLFVGPAGDCSDPNCMLTVADLYTSYAASPDGRLLSRLGSSGRNLFYTAVAENNGIFYEGLESRLSSQTFVRATLLSTGSSKVQRLPFGYKVRSFFCFDGRLYVYITRNSYHGYVAAVCTFVSDGVVGGEIIGLPDSPFDTDCCEESCSFGGCGSSCGCGGTSTCGCVSTNQTEMNTAVSGETTDAEECDVDELCRLFNCIKKLCRSSVGGNSCGNCGNGCSGGCGCGCGCNCGSDDGVMGECCTDFDGDCCENGTLNCTRFRRCRCNENSAGGENESCLPLPLCPQTSCCNPCDPTAGNVRCRDDNLRVTYTSANGRR